MLDTVSTLYRRYGPVLFSRCRRILKDDAMARDAVQESFVRLFPYLQKHTDEAQRQMLLLRISTNVCLDWLRKRRYETLAPEMTESVGPDLSSQLAERNFLLSLLQKAPEKMRAPALLHFLDGLSQDKIAQVLDVSPRTVFSRLKEFEAFAQKARANAEGAE